MFNVLVVHMCSVRQSHTKSLILFLFVFWEILYSHGLFIRYTFLVPGWTRFFFQDCSKSQWHRNNGERMWSMLSWQQHTVIDLSAAHPSYRSPISLHAEDALLIWDPVLNSELAVMFGLGWLETPQQSRLIEAATVFPAASGLISVTRSRLMSVSHWWYLMLSSAAVVLLLQGSMCWMFRGLVAMVGCLPCDLNKATVHPDNSLNPFSLSDHSL